MAKTALHTMGKDTIVTRFDDCQGQAASAKTTGVTNAGPRSGAAHETSDYCTISTAAALDEGGVAPPHAQAHSRAAAAIRLSNGPA